MRPEPWPKRLLLAAAVNLDCDVNDAEGQHASAHDPVTTLGVRPMKRLLAPALITMILAAALAAQAQAQVHSSAPGVASAKAAIDRLAGRLTYEIAAVHSSQPMSWQLLACKRRGAGETCTAEWIFAGETCSARLGAVAAGPSVRASELGKLQCGKQGSTQPG